MKVLHQIGDRALGGNFNSIQEILAYNGPISFDGVYESVYANYKHLLGKDVTFFFCHQHLGRDNSFDKGQPLSRFCDWYQILDMVHFLGAKVGFHGQTHARCTGSRLTAGDVLAEITPPYFLRKWLNDHGRPLILAWPYGDVDEQCVAAAKSVGYSEAWSVYPKGDDGNPFMKNRYFLNWDHHHNGEIVMKAHA